MTSVSKNVNIDELNEIVNKYKYIYHCRIKMKPIEVKSSTYINFKKENNKQDPILKLVIMLEYQNIKIFLLKVTFQTGRKKFL